MGEALLKVLDDEKLYEIYKERSLRRAAMYGLENVMGRWGKLIVND